MAQPAGVPGENLIAFPNPNPSPAQQSEAPVAEAALQSGADGGPKSWRSLKVKPAKTKKSKRNRPKLLPAQRYIATPAPGNFDRRQPAPDVDESDNRTSYYDTSDTQSAAIAHQRFHNIWARERDGERDEHGRLDPRDGLGMRLVREDKGLRMIERMNRDAALARGIVEQYQQQARAGDAPRELAARAIVAYKTAHRLETRAAEIQVKVNELTYLIDGTAHRVHHQVAIVRGHFWAEHEERALNDRGHRGGWRSKKEQVDAAELRRKFNKLFSAPEIPSVEEIDELIRTTRESFKRPGLASGDKEQP